MTGIARDPAEESLRWAPASPPTPGTSPDLSASGSVTDGGDGALLDGSCTSLSGNSSTADADDIEATPGLKPGINPALTILRNDLHEAFSENIFAKTCKVAVEALRRNASLANNHPPSDHDTFFPEYCPQTGDSSDIGTYTLRESSFWTCGFFPGTLYTLLERITRFPHSLALNSSSTGTSSQPSIPQLRSHLLPLCQTWSEPLHAMSTRTDTHDLGFIIMPALRLDWELTSNSRSLSSIIRAAHSLASRYVPSAGAIRSWDLVKRRDMEIVGTDENLLVIVDSMCNLDLLYYAAFQSGEGGLAEVATAHARTVLGTHLRPESTNPVLNERRTIRTGYKGQLYSTCHVANLDPRTGELKKRHTAQGYADDSTWARGQAWAILGYAQTYTWTHDAEFLWAACGCAEYFIQRLENSPDCVEVEVDVAPEEQGGQETERRKVGRYVPLWDFDAPIEDESNPTRDSSAGVIAANGMLVLSQALAGAGEAGLAARFRKAAVAIVRDTLDFALAKEKVRFRVGGSEGDEELVAEDVVEGSRFDALLKFGTANNNTYARKRYANHGLVYGDYYLVEFGNRLLRMGLA